MSPGMTRSASPLAVATPSWIDENMPREGSGFSTGRTRASFIAFTSRSSSARASIPTTTITSAAPPSRSTRMVLSSIGSPFTGASSFRPPKRSAEPAAVTTAIARNGVVTFVVSLDSCAERPQRALGEHARGALALADRAGGVVHRSRGLVYRIRDDGDGVVLETRADERRRVDRHRPRGERGDRDARVGHARGVPAHGRGDAGDREVKGAAVAQLQVGAPPAVARRQH